MASENAPIFMSPGDDPETELPANNGMTPYALAKCLGWKKVMARLHKAADG